jgi:hypothetical protein
VADNKERYEQLLTCIEAKMHVDPRAALRAQFELVTLAHADRWLAIRLDGGLAMPDAQTNERTIRENDVSGQSALRTLRHLIGFDDQ